MDTTIKQKAPRQGKKNQNTAGPRKTKVGLPPRSETSKSIAAPIAMGRVRRSGKPQMLGLPNGDIRVSHREYIQDLNGSVNFSATTLSLNPGLSSSFPWLTAIASRYESYLFEDLKIEFETQSPTSATGTVLIALDYDASDAAPSDKTAALSYRNSVRSPPWADCVHHSSQEDLHKQKSFFVRNGALSSNQDVKLYDVASAYVCTQGQAGLSAIGEIYISYTVRLMTPQYTAAPVIPTVITGGTFEGTTNAAPFAASTAGNLPATVAATGTTVSVTTFTFTSAFTGYITLYCGGTGLTTSNITGTATVGTNLALALASGLGLMRIGQVVAAAGQTVVLTVNNTTITQGKVFFGSSVAPL